MKKFLCLILCALLAASILAGCGKKNIAKVLVGSKIADSALLTQLAEAFSAETGYEVDLVVKDSADVEKALSKGDFDAALVITQNSAEKLGSGEWIGGNVFFDTLYLIGPQNDPASARHLGHYAMTDILKHLTLTGFTYVHPALVTPLGMKNISLWLSVDATPGAQQCLLAADAGQQLLLLADENSAYALVTRETWAQYGAGATHLTMLLSGAAGMTDQYTVLAKQIENPESISPAQAFCQWMMGQSARSIVVNYYEPNALVPVFESNIPAQ